MCQWNEKCKQSWMQIIVKAANLNVELWCDDDSGDKRCFNVVQWNNKV